VTDIRHIVFDLGNVLLAWDPEIPYRRLIPDEAERRRFLTEICNAAWNLEQDRGRPWREAEDLLIAEHPGLAPLIRAYFETHLETLALVSETEAILSALIAAGYDVTALTNYSGDTFAKAEAAYPVLQRFRGITVSGRVGMVKPDPAIYALHAARFGLDPAAILFFDDSQKNIEGARDAGWNAELFTSPEQMRADLAHYGIAVDARV
jgi:2-haloacid dehalogenase